jgi:hypothetical protein
LTCAIFQGRREITHPPFSPAFAEAASRRQAAGERDRGRGDVVWCNGI